MALWVLPLALAVGVLLGTLGGGGAILTVPILTTLVHQTPAQATAGSLVVVGLSSLVGLVPHLRAGRVRVTDGMTFGLLGVVVRDRDHVQPHEPGREQLAARLRPRAGQQRHTHGQQQRQLPRAQRAAGIYGERMGMHHMSAFL